MRDELALGPEVAAAFCETGLLFAVPFAPESWGFIVSRGAEDLFEQPLSNRHLCCLNLVPRRP